MDMSNDRHNQVLDLRAGEMVEVRSASEILATLDHHARLDAMPFMPEMLKFCGRQLRISKRADKTCDTIDKTGGRRLVNAVHLEGVRCDGEDHGGCQAACLIFWKEAWLKRIDPKPTIRPTGLSDESAHGLGTTADLVRTTCRTNVDGEIVFSCQATQLKAASSYLPWWDVRQYYRDVCSGNVRFLEAIRVLLMRLFNIVQGVRYGLPYPYIHGKLTGKTPSVSLNLQPNELVQIKTREEIEETLEEHGRNRGLLFDKELVPYCGGRYRVLRHVERIINEKTGKMMHLPTDCVILEGVTCGAKFSEKRLFCPRQIYSFWREIWLKRVDEHSRLDSAAAGNTTRR